MISNLPWPARRASARRWAGPLTVAAALVLASCGPTSQVASGIGTGAGETGAIGSGSVTVGLLLPTTATGGAGDAARAMRDAAELAVAEVPGADVRILSYDTRGTPDGAQTAARAAIDGGARILIGPLFASEVRAAGAVARSTGVPVIGFSTDSGVASDGVYLLSFLPESDIDRIVSYAARDGKRAFAALLPDNAYGSVVEAAFQNAVSRAGGRVVTIARYQPDEASMRTAVGQIASAGSQVDAVLVPDGPGALRALGPLLASAGVTTGGAQILGSGQWNDEAAWHVPELAGAWFAGPNPAGWQTLSARYQSRFGSAPPRSAALAYDAVSLTAALSRLGEAFSAETLTSPDGFAGVDGVFRFRRDGTNERGLAILQVDPGSARVRQPAPASFASGT